MAPTDATRHAPAQGPEGSSRRIHDKLSSGLPARVEKSLCQPIDSRRSNGRHFGARTDGRVKIMGRWESVFDGMNNDPRERAASMTASAFSTFEEKSRS